MPPLRGCPPLSPPPLSPPPSRPDGRERAPEPIFERISPSSPVRAGGRMGEEGWGEKGHRTEDAKCEKVELLQARLLFHEPPHVDAVLVIGKDAGRPGGDPGVSG